MKVLTVKEPYASAIRSRLKHIETRSWKTNYRGEVLIHAGKVILPNAGAEYILSKHNVPTRCGVIHCKANLVDCIYMDKTFIEKMLRPENRLEYNLGFYEEGRYAWVFENVESYDINAQQVVKGHLGLWNYTRFIIDEVKETVMDNYTNTIYEYSELETMYEDTYYEIYPDNELTDEDCIYARNCLLDHIKSEMDCDLMEDIYNMIF